MNHWSARRKRFIFLLVFLSFIILVGVPAGFLYYEPPTCFDGKQNGDETGVDCGGSCELLCQSESLPIIPKGDPRVLEVTPGFYEVVAIVENPNVTGRVDRARYTLKIFESNGINPIKIIESETFVPRSSTFAIFEGPFDLGDVQPNRATLEWHLSTFVWQKDSDPQKNIMVRDTRLTSEETEPRINALLVNNSTEKAENIELVALVSDEGGNIIAASKTFVGFVEKGDSVPIVFTWPRPFGSENVSVNITFRIFPDLSFIR